MTAPPTGATPTPGTLADQLGELSEEQRRAVTAPLGPVLVVAGAGSGKTRVLTHRAAWLMSEVGALSREVVALTFTNKAAREMRGRVRELLPAGERVPFFGTFHAFSLRLLRIHSGRLGLPSPFSIATGSEQAEILRKAAAAARQPLSPGGAPAVLRAISRMKSGLPAEFPDGMDGEAVRRAYAMELRRVGAIDFDDMLLFLRDLLQGDAEVRDRLQREVCHLLVDEMQDTNLVQYEIVKLLRPPGVRIDETSLFLVGDDDQSIYAFRGANVGNILAFERDYPGAKVFPLERNYRSTSEILEAATGVVRVNRRRRAKRVVAHRGPQRKVELVIHATDADEARWVASQVESEKDRGSVGILYRTNAQSRPFEETLSAAGVPYRMVGAIRFYERREIKDLLAWLTVAVQPRDSLAFGRAMGAPPRGVGEQTLRQLDEFAAGRGLTLLEAVRPYLASGATVTARIRDGLSTFVDTVDAVRGAGPAARPMLDELLRRTGYREWLAKEAGGTERVENVASLLSVAAELERELESPDAAELLAYASLQSEEEDDEAGAAVSLLTLHSAKGLEFRAVFLAGVEEGLLPHVSATRSLEDLEEERRLMYVGMTRAKDRLVLTRAESRRTWGETRRAVPSRFLSDVPEDKLQVTDLSPEQDPGVRFQKALAFFGHRDAPAPAGAAIPPAPRPHPAARPSPHGQGRPSPPAPRPGSFAQARLDAALAPTTDPYGLGTRVRHDKFGVGFVLGREGEGEDVKLTISFLGGVGRKKIILKHARLTIVP